MADDRGSIVRALFGTEELGRYLHPEQTGGSLHVAFPEGSAGGSDVTEVRGMSIKADDAAAGDDDFAIDSMDKTGEGYRLEFSYPREGIVGSATLSPSASGYTVDDIRVIER